MLFSMDTDPNGLVLPLTRRQADSHRRSRHRSSVRNIGRRDSPAQDIRSCLPGNGKGQERLKGRRGDEVPTLRFVPSYRLYASRRMLKKANILTHPTLARQDAPSPKQGRRRARTGGGTNRTSWSRSPVQWILANGPPPPAHLSIISSVR